MITHFYRFFGVDRAWIAVMMRLGDKNCIVFSGLLSFLRKKIIIMFSKKEPSKLGGFHNSRASQDFNHIP